MEISFKDVVYNGQRVRVPISPYPYAPLNQNRNEFRLIQLNQVQHESDPIVCSLAHHSLLDPPAYIALSYECGDPSVGRHIQLDGIAVPVTLNLELALRQLRARISAPLWVDSLCIDQNNEEERNTQILERIRAIYRDARHVTVSLGPDAHGSVKVMRMLQAMREIRRKSISLHDPRSESLPSPSNITRHANELRWFFARSYWQRIWVIQEIATSYSISIFCGRTVAEWDDMETLVRELVHDPTFSRDSLAFIEYLCDSRLNQIQGKAVGLLEVLYETHRSRSSDAKDKIFALLGLCFDRTSYLAEPKYGLSQEQVCFAMTNTVIKSKQSLDIIFLGPKSSRSTLNLPSWCPDYLNFPSWYFVKPLVKYLSGQDERHRVGKIQRRWYATGQNIAPQQSVVGNLLYVDGFHVDTINAVGRVLDDAQPLLQSRQSEAKSNTSSVKICRDLSKVLFLPYSKDGALYENEHQLLASLFEFESSTYEKYGVKGHFTELKEWRYLNQHFMVFGKTLQQRATGYTSTLYSLRDFVLNTKWDGNQQAVQQPQFDPREALTALSDLIADGLRLMTTSDEKLGWAHPNAMLGDKIFLLRGCSMPVILRKSRNRPGAFTVVGHAYLNDVMGGELWRKLDQDDLVNVALC